MSCKMTSPSHESWDERYGSTERYAYGTKPDPFLAEQRARVQPGSRWFVPGDGEGRNGVWLASLGAQVQTLDGSAVGVQKARALAAQVGVSLDAQVGDVLAWSPEEASLDGAAILYLHLPPPARKELHRRILAALKPGGLLIIEGFHPRQLEYQERFGSRGGPRTREPLYEMTDLMEDLEPACERLLLEERDVLFEEGLFHQGRGAVVCAIYKKVSHAS